ncbi:acyl-CoA thioesterase [Tropicimonas sediminicola]|uniref:Acyl-CoA thioester hydrolase n=1 Tax=Tropicimonas sediminicola TaxID=1031541 RepID=A0A239EM85_9RHOB|nr:acyl-CoA thioesterase [Tropicimonas sediminicola]SNS45775.1 acyl-CoA thioester hydrolase [Tropicimonas sediminicola]
MPLPFLTPLGPDDLTRHGIPDTWRYGMADRVRFSELDALNHVNHTAYLRWFESLRLPYCRDYGISNYDADSPELVLKSVEARYHAPMFSGEDYIVTARTVSFRTTSFRMEYAVFAPDCRVEGSALVVLLQRDGSGKFPLTDAMKAALRERDNARPET